LSKHAVETATAQCLSLGYLAERDLPDAQRQGGRKLGLFATDREPPAIRAGSGGLGSEKGLDTPTESSFPTTRPPLKERDSGRVVGEPLRSPNARPLPSALGGFRAGSGGLGGLGSEAAAATAGETGEDLV
jgi:hypothetical protein